MDEEQPPSSGEDAAAAPFFGPDELAALFPAALPPVRSFGRRPPPPAAHRTLPLSEFRRVLGRQPALAALVDLNLALSWFAAQSPFRNLLCEIGAVLLVAAVWQANVAYPRFPLREQILATFCYVLCISAILIFPPLFTRWKLRFASYSAKQSGEPDMSGHSLAGVVQWCRLAEARSAEAGKASRLLEHEPDDPLCPCPRPSCAGGTLLSTTVYAYADDLARVAAMAGHSFLAAWTLQFTFPDAARTWWGIGTLVVFYALYLVVNGWVTILGARFRANLATLDLSRKLHHRAVWLCLSSLVDGFQAEIDSGGCTLPGDAPAHEPYQSLHFELTTVWQQRFAYLAFNSIYLGFYATFTLVPALIMIAFGGCLPALYLAFLVYIGIAVFADGANVAAANSHIETVMDAYRAARLALRQLAALPNVTPEAAARISRHDQVIGSFLDADRWKARMLGFAVTPGSVRRMVVTLITVCVALWGVLRSSGVVFTLDMACSG
ncbi:hypothetical protein DFJ74DRAFT_115656 [Hyaloraphidium curvatum]|nr:hypothetical protein DFJ74DRAFT_115656 [Hyaloraphidium curvatum]